MVDKCHLVSAIDLTKLNLFSGREPVIERATEPDKT
jgi:hypothetical protein